MRSGICFHSTPNSPLAATPEGMDLDTWFDMRVIYQQRHEDIDINALPTVFKPEVGPFKLDYLEKVFGVVPEDDIFVECGVSRDGAIVVVRPDQYVATVLPLTATDELAAFFAPLLSVDATK